MRKCEGKDLENAKGTYSTENEQCTKAQGREAQGMQNMPSSHRSSLTSLRSCVY